MFGFSSISGVDEADDATLKFFHRACSSSALALAMLFSAAQPRLPPRKSPLFSTPAVTCMPVCGEAAAVLESRRLREPFSYVLCVVTRPSSSRRTSWPWLVSLAPPYFPSFHWLNCLQLYSCHMHKYTHTNSPLQIVRSSKRYRYDTINMSPALAS